MSSFANRQLASHTIVAFVLLALGGSVRGQQSVQAPDTQTVGLRLRLHHDALNDRLNNSVMRMRMTRYGVDRETHKEANIIWLSQILRSTGRVMLLERDLWPGEAETWDFEKPATKYYSISAASRINQTCLTFSRWNLGEEHSLITICDPNDQHTRSADFTHHAAALESNFPWTDLSFAEVIETGTGRFGMETKFIGGGECRPLRVIEPTREYTFWIDTADPLVVRRAELFRKAEDELYGMPMWLASSSRKDRANDGQPDEADLLIWEREVFDFSDFREVTPGIRLPRRAERASTRIDRERRTKTVRFTIDVVALDLPGKPLPDSAFVLPAPDGNSVMRVEPNPAAPMLEWRGGKVVPLDPQPTTDDPGK
jgi:hypothetical protein